MISVQTCSMTWDGPRRQAPRRTPDPVKVEDRTGVGNDDHESNRCPVAHAISASTFASATGSLSYGCVAASASGATITRTSAPSAKCTDAGSSTLPSLTTPTTSMPKPYHSPATMPMNGALRPGKALGLGGAALAFFWGRQRPPTPPAA